jgi:hypothetical protein
MVILYQLLLRLNSYCDSVQALSGSLSESTVEVVSVLSIKLSLWHDPMPGRYVERMAQ